MKEPDYCKYAKYVDKGIEQYLLCSLTGKYCLHQKYCNKRKRVVHRGEYVNCTIRERKEH